MLYPFTIDAQRTKRSQLQFDKIIFLKNGYYLNGENIKSVRYPYTYKGLTFINFEQLSLSKNNSNVFGIYFNWQKREKEFLPDPGVIQPTTGYKTRTKNIDLYYIRGKRFLKTSNMGFVIGPKVSLFYTRVNYVPKLTLVFPEIHNRVGVRIGAYISVYKKLTKKVYMNISVFGDLIETYGLFNVLQNPTIAPRLQRSSSIENMVLPKRIYFSFGVGSLIK